MSWLFFCPPVDPAGVPDEVAVMESRTMPRGDIEGAGLGLRHGVRHTWGMPDTGRQRGHPQRVPVFVGLRGVVAVTVAVAAWRR